MTNILHRSVTLRDTWLGKLEKPALLQCFFFCCAILSCLAPAASEASEKIAIYFYSSETNINNFKSLKTGFDSYLSKFGPYEFQPFSDRETFEQHIRNKEKCLLILSSWHYSKIYKTYALAPSLIGMRNGKDYQKRILVTSTKFADMKHTEKGPVASASNIPHTRSVLKEMFENKAVAESVMILKVPKDVDALMSVGFDMSKAALITENAFNNLKMLDPELHGKMKMLVEGKESLLQVLAVPQAFQNEANALIQIIKKMPDDSDGMNLIKMFDLDSWKKADSSDNSKLEG